LSVVLPDGSLNLGKAGGIRKKEVRIVKYTLRWRQEVGAGSGEM